MGGKTYTRNQLNPFMKQMMSWNDTKTLAGREGGLLTWVSGMGQAIGLTGD